MSQHPNSKSALRDRLRLRRRDYTADLPAEDRQLLELETAKRVLAAVIDKTAFHHATQATELKPAKLNTPPPDTVGNVPLSASALYLASYCAMGSEISPEPLISLTKNTDFHIALPWFASRTHPMSFRYHHEDLALNVGPYNILQPQDNQPEVLPSVLVLPLIGVDLHGNRIGQGAGHYDRALKSLRSVQPILTIGLAWDHQIVDAIDADPWDEPVDLVITPTRTIET